MDKDELKQLEDKAFEIRKLTIEMLADLGVGHIGGSMSIVEILTLLYFKYMNVKPDDPQWKDRDKFILSKGHAGPTLYATLAVKGFFDQKTLFTINRPNTILPSHCDRQKTPGIDASTGSLGQGLSVAVGMALGAKLDNLKGRVYCLIGDGESQEGQIWEAAMLAANKKLDNLTAFTDYNKLQIDGFLDDVISISDITSKWVAFGWFTQRVNGHNLMEMDKAIQKAINEKNRPSMIILDTIKGKGANFCEGQISSHNMKFDMEIAKSAIQALEATRK